MTCLSLRLDTAGSTDPHTAVTGWLLPAAGWLVPVAIVGTVVVISGQNMAPGMLLKTEPANGHHCLTACVTSASLSLAA
jgi:hypothetical protein